MSKKNKSSNHRKQFAAVLADAAEQEAALLKKRLKLAKQTQAREERKKVEAEFSMLERVEKTGKKRYKKEIAKTRTFICVKPDAYARKMVGPIISRFERRGYTLVGGKIMLPTEELVREHYIEHAERPFLGELVDFMTGGPVFAMIWEGEEIIAQARKMIGATNPSQAAPGTIRGDYAQETSANMVHASDSVESADREISLWFKEGEIMVACAAKKEASTTH